MGCLDLSILSSLLSNVPVKTDCRCSNSATVFVPFGLWAFFALIIVASPFGATQLNSTRPLAVMALRHFAGMQKAADATDLDRGCATTQAESSQPLLCTFGREFPLLVSGVWPPYSACRRTVARSVARSLGRSLFLQVEKLVLPSSLFGRKNEECRVPLPVVNSFRCCNMLPGRLRGILSLFLSKNRSTPIDQL